MKEACKNITIKLVILLLTGVMGLLIANKATFMHVHKLSDGTIIVHAHPYDKSHDSKPYKSHQHTKAEFIFFQNLEILFLVVFLSLTLIALVKKEKVLFELITIPDLSYINLRKSRAPPIS